MPAPAPLMGWSAKLPETVLLISASVEDAGTQLGANRVVRDAAVGQSQLTRVEDAAAQKRAPLLDGDPGDSYGGPGVDYKNHDGVSPADRETRRGRSQNGHACAER